MRLLLFILAFSGTLVAQSSTAPNLNSIGPKIGSIAPAFSGVDQFGQARTLQSLLAREGLMLVFFRSADW